MCHEPATSSTSSTSVSTPMVDFHVSCPHRDTKAKGRIDAGEIDSTSMRSMHENHHITQMVLLQNAHQQISTYIMTCTYNIPINTYIYIYINIIQHHNPHPVLFYYYMVGLFLSPLPSKKRPSIVFCDLARALPALPSPSSVGLLPGQMCSAESGVCEASDKAKEGK